MSGNATVTTISSAERWRGSGLRRPHVVAIIEARMGSTRLSGKVLLHAAGKPLLAHLIERLQRAKLVDAVVVATTDSRADDPIADLAAQLGFACFRGSEEDVLGRVLSAARANDADVIVEITGDCPAIDPALVDECVSAYLGSDDDFVSNSLKRSYPGGMDTQVFATQALAEADVATLGDAAAREHVSLYLYEHPERYQVLVIEAPRELAWPSVRIELDTREDYELIRRLFEALYPIHPRFGIREMLSYLREHSDLLALNKAVERRVAR